jgi:hypothetical protein
MVSRSHFTRVRPQQNRGRQLNPAACTHNGADCGWGDWALWTGASYQLTLKAQLNAQVAYTDSEILEVTGNVAFRPVNNFAITPEVTYVNWEKADKDQFGGALRFERKF